eukprot:3983852-Prymnesium_polylepis.2
MPVQRVTFAVSVVSTFDFFDPAFTCSSVSAFVTCTERCGAAAIAEDLLMKSLSSRFRQVMSEPAIPRAKSVARCWSCGKQTINGA